MSDRVTRLAIDARMLGYSGIGTYLEHVLPLALPQLTAFAPVVLGMPDQVDALRERIGSSATVRAWHDKPMSAADVLRSPAVPELALWWIPHFNVPLRSSAPLVVTLHDLLPLHREGRASSPGRRLVLHAWLRAIRRRALRVICVSAQTRSEAITLGRLQANRLELVPLGVDAEWKPAHDASLDAPYIVFVGLLKPHKNLGALLDAFDTISNQIPHRLVIIGKHAGLRSIDAAALARARSMAPRVEVHDCVSKDALIRIVAHAELLVHPSWHEGFGLTPLEAMAAGVPVIASPTGAIRDFGGDAIRFCDPASPNQLASDILEVLRDAGMRAGMRERGLALAARYTWDACALATVRVLHDAMRETGAKA